MRYALCEVRKTISGVIGFALTVAATILSVGPALIPATWLPWIIVAIGVGSTYGIFKVPNVPPPGRPSRPDVSETNAPGETLAPTPVERALGNLDEPLDGT